MKGIERARKYPRRLSPKPFQERLVSIKEWRAIIAKPDKQMDEAKLPNFFSERLKYLTTGVNMGGLTGSNIITAMDIDKLRENLIKEGTMSFDRPLVKIKGSRADFSEFYADVRIFLISKYGLDHRSGYASALPAATRIWSSAGNDLVKARAKLQKLSKK